MAKLGSKTKYSKDIINKICSLIESGADNKDAFIQAGISETTGYKWLDESNEENPLTKEECREFRERMEGAKAKRTTVLTNRIIRASEPIYLRDENNRIVTDEDGKPIVYKGGDWRAAAWYLERTEPERFARKEELRHSGELTSKHELPKELEHVIKAGFRKALKEQPPTEEGSREDSE